MITLEQIRRLQDKVETAVLRISELKSENSTLKNELDRHLNRIKELEDLINEFKDAQTEIEAGILSALDQLDRIENEAVSQNQSQVTTIVDQPEAAAAADFPAGDESSSDNSPADSDLESEQSSSGHEDSTGEDPSNETESGELDIF
jgi:chromosome segregation ATPase